MARRSLRKDGEVSPFEAKAFGLTVAVLRGERPKWPFDIPSSTTEYLKYIRRQGLAPLIASLEKDLHWPTPMVAKLRLDAVNHAMWDLRHQAVIGEVLSRFGEHGIGAVVFKGTGLANSVYPSSELRRRSDTDLIIPYRLLGVADRLLESCGFRRKFGNEQQLYNYQIDYGTDDGGHLIDLHWRVSNSHRLAAILGYDEISDKAVPLPRLSSEARAAWIVHALLIACFHRAKHRKNREDRLAWVYDIHLVSQALSLTEWRVVIELAASKKMVGLLSRTVIETRELFGTQIFPEITSALAAARKKRDAVSVYFEAHSAKRALMDFLSIPGIGGKLRFLFPGRVFLENRFAVKISSIKVPWYYVLRFLSVGRPRK